MSKYTDAVERGLQGLTAVSTGLCGECRQCAEHCGFDIDQDVEETEGEAEAEEQRMAKFDEAVSFGKCHDEGGFSWAECGICGSHLGGNRYVWHGIFTSDLEKKLRTVRHFDDACTDCVMFLANGDEPDRDGEEN